MAKNKEPRNPLLKGIRSLNNISKASDTVTYGISKDIATTLSDNVDDYVNKLAMDADKDKSMINYHMTNHRLGATNTTVKGTSNNIYDLITDSSIMSSIQTIMGVGENARFSQILKDYEIIKRCIPQVHKVLTMIKNNIISPDAMVSSAIGLELPPNISDADKDKISGIIEDYRLNRLLNDWVMDYLIASVSYVVPIPYSQIPDMMSAEFKNIDECIDYLEEHVNKPATLYECTSHYSNSDNILSESVMLDTEEINEFGELVVKNNLTVTNESITAEVNNCLKNIEFIKGGEQFFRNAVLNEAVAMKNNMSQDISMKSILKRLKSHSKTIHPDMIQVAEGMVDEKTIKDIRKNVDFKGCHLENLDPAKVLPFKLRDTLVGYFYVEDRGLPGDTSTNNMSSIMSKINASVYMKRDTTNPANRVEDAIVRKIGDKLIEVIDSKFINDNYDDLDIIYEFVRANELHRKKKRVVFFHSDDLCEFRRSDGSIMKNCMFAAKIYILTMLSNVLANATKGMDRNIHYVKTGLTTDIEGHVNSAIRAIKQGQIRYSDIGTINEIFNMVGSAVDVFMPMSVDGDKPIETETISGQKVDMDDDFLKSIIKSIVQSFGAPSSIVDDFENIDFAKTVSMSNIDMAKLCLDAQLEICEPLTKLLRLIISYEIPEFTQLDQVKAKLNPPIVIVQEMNKDRINSINEISDVIANLRFSANDQESIGEKRIRLFKYEYFRKNMPTLDWDVIDEIITKVEQDVKEDKLKSDITSNNDQNAQQQAQYGGNGGYDNY